MFVIPEYKGYSLNYKIFSCYVFPLEIKECYIIISISLLLPCSAYLKLIYIQYNFQSGIPDKGRVQ